MLAFERQWWRHAGAKETAIRDRFGVPPTRYYQVLNALVDRPEALAADPLLVRRLRRLRRARQRQRSSRVLVNESYTRLDLLTVGRHAASGSDGRDLG